MNINAYQWVLLAYPDLSKSFDVYTDAGHSQLGAAICQNDKPIAFYDPVNCILNKKHGILPLKVNF
jgi:hypothetical protein